MEVRAARIGRNGWVWLALVTCALLLFQPAGWCQSGASGSYTIRDGRMYISLPKHIDKMQLDSFIVQYDLADLGLTGVLRKNDKNKLRKMGWTVVVDNDRTLTISKSILGPAKLLDPGKQMVMTEAGAGAGMNAGHPNNLDLFPARNDNLIYGYNRFSHKYPFAISDSMVNFYMRGRTGASRVLLAGSFTNWQQGALRMLKTDSGWTLKVKLGPGKYWYKFIVDGVWYIDRDNDLQEDDGQGNENSVFYKPNVTFRLNHFINAKSVYLTGSFNHWKPDELPMESSPTGWKIRVYLSEGTHAYKYLVDGVPHLDPDNPYRLPDGHNGFNSVFSVGTPHLFSLEGHHSAEQVILTGSFNKWNAKELPMKKTVTGWELPYTLGQGNYTYKFLVDGKAIADPNNPYFVGAAGENSYLIVEPNYTFRLNGHSNAGKVYLAGDFNDWTPNSLLMKKVGSGWEFPVHLSIGKHLYKFVVDGDWIIDPDGLWEENEYHTGNSVIWKEN